MKKLRAEDGCPWDRAQTHESIALNAVEEAYEVVDAILTRMIEEGQHREEIVNAGFDSEVVEKIHAMIMHNEKKRYQFPPVLRLSSCTFGHERLMPLTNKYGD